MTYMIDILVRQLPKACIISIMHSGRPAPFILPFLDISVSSTARRHHAYVVHGHAVGVAEDVIIYTQSPFLSSPPSSFPAFCLHTTVCFSYETPDRLSRRQDQYQARPRPRGSLSLPKVLLSVTLEID
ncbi:uncharacterized protein TrAFT101_007412 [Trichoderma asperellum]|uniref:uncharacterized protein n=1 Tax=Trichoderma asperellum TaxID=101201 RepID=UPI00331F2897|nr:hypothetical protein TrAFT101_007412 [Trichoderma asperellum]